MGNVTIWPIIISALALVPGIYAVIKGWQKTNVDKSDIVFQNAMSLIEANKRQAEENEKQANNFREQLKTANSTITELTVKLNTANQRADKLSADLAEANMELVQLRSQIESMSKQVDGDSNGRN